MSWAQRGGVINPPVICWPQFCCCRRFCWRDRWSLNRAVKWLSVSTPGPSRASSGGGVQPQNQAALGLSASVFLQGLGNSSLKDLLCVMQEVGRPRGQERRERGKGRGSSHNSAFIPSVTER